MTTPYDDIIRLPRHVSRRHPPMSLRDRAAQFAPFAALTGFGAVIDETGRATEARRELDEQELAELDRKLAALVNRIAESPRVAITWFVPDERKSGGSYRTVEGAVQSLSPARRTLAMTDGTVIPLDDIIVLDGDL